MTERRRGFEMFRASVGDAATVRIYGDIGDSWWGDSVTAADFAKELDALGQVGHINLHLNSPGGDAFDGIAILNTLRDHPATIAVHVDGLAASAASIIAMAGDEVIMGRGAQMMIHDPSGLAWGPPAEIQKLADELNSMGDSMAAVYREKAGGTNAAWRTAMQAETWYSDKEAVDAGLADRVKAKDEEGDGVVDVPEAIAAMLRRGSRIVARYRHGGRQAAPAPYMPRPVGRRKEGSGPVALSEERLSELRTALGLEDDADEDAVADAMLERLNDEGDGEGEGGDGTEARARQRPTTRSNGDVITVDREAWAQVQADAEAGRQARREQIEARRRSLVQAAISDGRIPRARRDHWLTALEADEEGATAQLNGLAKGLIPVSEKGHDAPSASGEGPDDSLEAARAHPGYANWKVV